MPSEDGWEPAHAGPEILEWITVPGTNPPVSLQLMKGWPLAILRAFAADFNAYVESLRDADSAAFTPTNSVPTSNHLNGSAMDLNWNSHRFQISYDGFSADQIATCRELLDWYEGTIQWGQDWGGNPYDCMHWNMGYNTYSNPAVADFIKRKIRPDGFSTFRRGGTPSGGAQPASPAAAVTPDAAVAALYDAVPVIDQARAAQLVDAMRAGLELAQCDTVNRIAMALAQWGHESDGFATTVEYGSGQRYAPYIGRTWIQITWQANYSAFGRWAADQGLIDDPDYFVDNPTALADLRWAGIGAAWYWTVARPSINSLCDQGDIVGVTQLINGGQNGIADRRARYRQALALGDRLLELVTPTTPTGGTVEPLTADEQRELLAKVRDIWDQLRGPGGNGWPQLGKRADGSDLTPVDAIAEIRTRLTTTTFGGSVVLTPPKAGT